MQSAEKTTAASGEAAVVDAEAELLHVGSGRLGVLLVELGDLDFFGEADFFEEPDAVVVDVELVPGEAVTGADGVGVVVVVPAFAAGEDGDPPVVAGVVLGLEAALAPEVGCGVDEPGGVEADGDAEKGSPEHHADGSGKTMAGRESSSDGKLRETGDDERHVVVLREPDVDAVAGEVGSVTAEESGLRVESATGEDPASVRPPGAIVRCMGIASLIGVLMMDAMRGDPEDGSSFESEAAAGGDEVLQPLGNAIAAVGEQAVIGHADADVDGEEVHDEEGAKILPGEEEERGDGTDVEEPHGDGGDPVDAALLVLAAHAQILLDLLRDLLDGGERAGCGWGALLDFRENCIHRVLNS